MKQLTEKTLRDAAPKGARRVARRLLRQARRAVPRLLDPDDATAVHDARVAVRRLRSALRAYDDQLPGKGIKRMRRALARMARETGSTRDYEVKIEWLRTLRAKVTPRYRSDIDWLIERLTRRLDDSATAMLRDVPDEFATIDRQLSEVLKLKPSEASLANGTFGQVTGELLLAHCDELRRHVDKVRSPRDIEEAHQTRLQVKRVRYLLEPMNKTVVSGTDILDRLRRTQTLLGDFNDLAVLNRELLRAAEYDALSRVESIWTEAVGPEGDADALRRAVRSAKPRHGIFALAQVVKRRALELFTELGINDAMPRLIKDLERLGRRLVDSYTAEHEIERKYLLKSVPKRAVAEDPIEIEQGYLPGKHPQTRLRRERLNGTARYLRTLKRGQGLKRLQFEEETTKEEFEREWPATEGRRVAKRRHRVQSEDLTWEVDAFTDRDLVLAEIELPSPETRVTLPAWLRPYVIREVTDESRYSNVNLAR